MLIVCLAAAHDCSDDSDGSSISETFAGGINQKEEDAIFIRNLPSTVKFNELLDLFSKVGRIKVCLTYISKKFSMHLFHN
jgi:RNA recognition motif-containing protein